MHTRDLQVFLSVACRISGAVPVLPRDRAGLHQPGERRPAHRPPAHRHQRNTGQ